MVAQLESEFEKNNWKVYQFNESYNREKYLQLVSKIKDKGKVVCLDLDCGIDYKDREVYGFFHRHPILLNPEKYPEFKNVKMAFAQTPKVDKMIKKAFEIESTEIGLPLEIYPEAGVLRKTRPFSVVYNHRIDDPAKRLDLFVQLSKALPSHFSFYCFGGEKAKPFVKGTKIQVLDIDDRQEYLEQLRKMQFVFSMSELEFFSYSTIDAIMSGCIPVLRKSTYEHIPSYGKVNTFQEAVNYIKKTSESSASFAIASSAVNHIQGKFEIIYSPTNIIKKIEKCVFA